MTLICYFFFGVNTCSTQMKILKWMSTFLDSPCIANWTLQKNVKGNEDKINFHSSCAMLSCRQLSWFVSNNAKGYKYMRSSKLSQQEDSSSKILKELLLYGVSQKHSIVHLVLQNTPMQRAIEVPWNWENDLLKVKTI